MEHFCLVHLAFGFFFLASPCGCLQDANIKIPTFSHTPPNLVEFSNSTGAILNCKTQGNSKIQWFLKDDTPVADVKNLRATDEAGNLMFSPFSAEHFRQDVHATVYKCTATNILGTVVSHDIQVRAIVLQPYDIYVYDVYAMQGNTAVIRCHIPTFLMTYVNVTAWIRDSVVVIKSTQIEKNSKYSLMPTGELIVKDVDTKDAMTSFQCQTYNRLNEEIVKSSTNGKLFVTEPRGNMPPKIMFATKNVIVQIGERAFLPCEAQANPPAEISWQKNGLQERFIDGRRIIQISGSLLIKNVLSSDNATYRCTASNDVGQDYLDIDLIVTEPLSVSMDLDSIVVDVGKSASLRCNPMGFPQKELKWFKNGKRITYNQDIMRIDNNASLKINSVSAKDKGIYQCCVRNEFEMVCASTALLLGDIPPSLIEKFVETVNIPGVKVVLKCTAEGNPVPKISWLIDENVITSTPEVHITENAYNGRIRSEFIIEHVKVEDGGLYKCVAENQAGKVFHWARINIRGNGGVRQQPPLNVVNGDSAILNCPLFGYPMLDVKWVKDGTELPYEIRQVQAANDSLIIHNLHRTRDSGVYICSAKDSAGVTLQSSVQLNVLVAPKLSPFSFQDELVQEGSRGRLQCIVIEGDEPLKIQWLKDGNTLPADLGVLIRDIDEFSSILTISAITPRHNGKYTCQATNAAGIASFSTILAVNVAPKITPFNFPESGLTEGALARVSCVVYQGDLPIELNWLKDGKLISTGDNIITKSIDDYSNILTIENVKRHHSGNYTCVARNSAAAISHTTELLITVPPKIVPFAFQDDHITEGSLLRISCVVSRGDLPLIISWLKDEMSLPKSLSVKKIDSYSTVLSIDPVLKEHSGNYTCKAQNQAGIATYRAELIVQVPPKWIVEPFSQTVRNGNDAVYHCKAEGYPPPAITWMFAKDNKSPRNKLNTNSDVKIMNNGTLVMKSITKDKEGRYICIASNGVGLDLSMTVTLSILTPPAFEWKEMSVNGVLGEAISIICSPDGDKPIKMSWLKSNKVISASDSRYRVIEDNFNLSSNLTISEVTHEDAGMFVCKAENTFGNDSFSVQLNVQEPPASPIFEQNPSTGNRTISLSWTKPFDGNSEIKYYFIQYKKLVDNWQLKKYNETVDGSKTHMVVRNLHPATSYTFRIAAVNNIGISKFSNEITQTTDADVPSGTVQNVEIESVDGNALRIIWKAPRKDTWNGPIRGYNIGYRMNGTNEPYEFSALEVPEDYDEDLIYQITNLRKYTLYLVVIQAYNEKGVGPLLEPILVMTSEDVPSQSPDGLRCSALSAKSIYVLWDPLPADNVNGILRGYKVYYKPTNEWYASQGQFKISDKEKITLQNLDVNANYSIAVLAFTKVGDGVKSKPVYCKTHEDVPDRPSEIKVLPSSSDSVVIAWKPPSRLNGDLIKYNVYYRPLSQSEEEGADVLLKTEQSKSNNIHAFQSDSEYFEVKGLRKSQKYAFWVSATSAIGEGQHSDIIAQTVADSTVAATSASFDNVIHTPWKRDITLPCRAVGIPTPQRKWTFKNSLVPVGGRTVLLSDGTLLINKVDNVDNGNYTCTIYNELGKDQVQYSLNVLVPPSSPLVDIISKTRSSIQLKWKPGPDGGDSIKGYTLHYRKDEGEWETMELGSDQELITINNLACGTNYQVFMEAYNKIGKGMPCDTIRVSTEGSEITIPTKDQLLHEGSTFVSVHLESWPVNSCPVRSFQVDYKTLNAEEWITVSSSIRPTQRKLVIPGLASATWYALRVTAFTNGDAVPAEYTFATLTTNGGTIPPPEIKMTKPQAPVYIFYLDPYIFIPSVALLIVVIITSVVVCLYMKRKNGSEGAPSDYGSSIDNTYGKASSYTASTLYATIPHRHKSGDPNPYASGRVGDYFPDRDDWVETRTLTRAMPHHSGVRVLPVRVGESIQQQLNRHNQNLQETTFAFDIQPNSDYDRPPKGM